MWVKRVGLSGKPVTREDRESGKGGMRLLVPALRLHCGPGLFGTCVASGKCLPL